MEPIDSDWFGEAALGDAAREELEWARSDPRTGRGPGAPFGDFLAAVAEAERLRSLSEWGLLELTRSVDREEAKLGVRCDDPDLAPAAKAALQAAWERAELASAELDNDLPYLNGVTLVSMYGALDALVEQLVPVARDLWVKLQTRSTMKRAELESPEVTEQLKAQSTEQQWANIESIVAEHFHAILPPDTKRGAESRVRGAGAARYETALAHALLGERADRPVPADLDEALREIANLRNVLVHRAGRLDAEAIRDASSLTVRRNEGDLVRITQSEFRRYSAAIRTYGQEIAYRLLGPELVPWHDLARWRDNRLLGS